MPVVGLIPFVYSAIKRKRRSSARANRYAEIAAAARAHGPARFDGGGRAAYQSQSCHFAVRPPSPPDELGFSFGGDSRPPPESLLRKLSSADRYERLLATDGREDARFDGGGYQSQSCRFAARPWKTDEAAVQRDGRGSARRTQPEDEPRQLLPPASLDAPLATGETRGRDSARFDGGGYQSQSCRFAVRPSPGDELLVSRQDGGASRHPLARREDLSPQLLLPASRKDRIGTGETRWREREHARLDGGGSHQSQSCRFAAQPSDIDGYELGFSQDGGYGVAGLPPEDLSRKLLLPAGRREREVSRSLRFSSKRVFAWVSGA